MNSGKNVLLMLLTALPMAALAGSGPHWGYEGHEGPQQWGTLHKDYATCGIGKAQSPINITETRKEKLPAIEFSYQASPLRIINNGHTVQVNLGEAGGIKIGKDSYKLLQFHVHTPSEEQVKGKAYDMVAHFVHRNDAGQLAVIGVLFEKGQDNAALKPILANLPKKAGPEKTVTGVSI